MDQTERQGRTSCKLNYWRYLQCLFSCSSLDTHFGDLSSLERCRSPSVQFCFSKLGWNLILQHPLFDPCFTELTSVYWKDQALTASPSTASENTRCSGLSCENSYLNTELIWEISHNLFFRPFYLKSWQILERKEEECQKRHFKMVKGGTIGLIPKKRFQTDTQSGVRPSQMFDIFLHTKPTVGCDHNPVTLRNEISQNFC